MSVYTYSEARRKLADLLDQASARERCVFVERTEPNTSCLHTALRDRRWMYAL